MDTALGYPSISPRNEPPMQSATTRNYAAVRGTRAPFGQVAHSRLSMTMTAAFSPDPALEYSFEQKENVKRRGATVFRWTTGDNGMSDSGLMNISTTISQLEHTLDKWSHSVLRSYMCAREMSPQTQQQKRSSNNEKNESYTATLC